MFFFFKSPFMCARLKIFSINFQIKSFTDDNKMVNLVFYGDRTTAKMFKSALVDFEEGFNTYVPNKRLLLDKAVKEALLEQIHPENTFHQ